MKKNAERLMKMNKRVALVERLFRHFVANDWCFETARIFEMCEQMSKEEQEIFKFNPRVIDWKVLVALNHYGI